MDPIPPRLLRLLTYNIHKGIGGLDRRYRLGRIARVIAAQDADVVLLQEVDEGAPRSCGERQVDVLGERLGYPHRAYFPNVTLRRGHYGNALLSRTPIDHAENLDLSVWRFKRRGALHARLWFDDPSGRRCPWIFNVHLGLTEIERRIQLRRLVAWTQNERPDGASACVIAGDFNDTWGRLGRVVLEPAGYHTRSRSLLTFPAWAPLLDLDRCYVRGPIVLTRASAPRLGLVRHASDHLPVVVELRFR